MTRFGLRNWKVSVRLVALIVIPTIVAGVLAGLRVSSALGNATTFGRIEQLAALGDKLSVLTHALEGERDMTALYVASTGNSATKSDLQRVEGQVDTAVQGVRAQAGHIDGSYPSLVRTQVRDILNRLDQLPSLRAQATQSKLPPDATVDKYSEFVSDFLNFNNLISQGSSDADLAETSRSLSSLAAAKEDSSKERGYLAVALAAKGFQPGTFEEFQAARSQRDTDIAAFQASATAEENQLYSDTVAGPEVDQAELIRQQADNTASKAPDLQLVGMQNSDPRTWFNDMTVRSDKMRVVEDRLVHNLLDKSNDLKTQAQRSAMLVGGLLLFVLLLVILAVVIVAQSLVRPLRRLRTGALDVAGSRLPDFVRRLREPDVEQVNFDVEPIEVDSTDEIGEVARAFDEVHREAVRLASNEAMMRGNVNAMFVNLSRRSQSLIERQLRLIEDLEQSEQDSGRLDSLFKLDHLATRMRRNCENLLVLGGQDQARRWNKPVPLVDIVRASLSEVEQYERITLRIQDEVSVNGRVVNDLVHLVAELVENSTSFSPEHTKVAVSGHLLSGGGAMLQISDSGVGMSPEELEEANWRLANPPTIDVSVSRRMGLFVVGRLAQRHGIRVELRAALSGGLTAFVILAPNAIMQDAGKVRPQRIESLPGGPAMDRSAVQPPPVRGEISRPGEMPRPNEMSRPGDLPRPGEMDRPPVPDTPREPLRSHGSTLPKRKSAPTSPPGRGPGSTAPSRSSRPQGVPPSARSAGPPPSQPPPEPPPRPQPQPQPAVSAFGDSRPMSENNGRSPIFEAMQSEWFQRRKTGSMNRADSSPPREWSSPGDEGWRAAETIRAPATGGQTSTGLPKRVPGSNRIPGSVGAVPRPEQPAQPAQPAQQAPPPAESRPPQAEAVRNRFASFQQGVRKGRAATRPEDDERENQ
ncbi:nitrate- and nitrite sensing domain-containing protein [Actinomadura sp. DC4]|uniref:sensor histidine kinase n=1 Tax=Actinomadura sp. DC4 TaxID=3055069 RepID=UPI0025AFE8E3|nr:nitrate- and nitrite sensing domain-containing protein [Actinomadura sp. DC4]MDN3360114.1 nitrate- and nitrite sensing domain-containing protein [Actinomadura sp. DC4]